MGDTIYCMPRVRCRFLVPLAYNDGSPVEPEKFLAIKKRLDSEYGGCRICSPSEGVWEGQVEGVHEIEVAVLRKQVPALRRYVLEIGADLGQLYMYFDAPRDDSIEILNVATGREDEEENGDQREHDQDDEPSDKRDRETDRAEGV